MPTVADIRSSASKEPRCFDPHFETEHKKVATAEIRNIYINTTTRICNSLAVSCYHTRRYRRYKLYHAFRDDDALLLRLSFDNNTCTDYPNTTSIKNAKAFLDHLKTHGLAPSRTIAIPSGGIALYFFSNHTTTYLEFLNDGEGVAVSYGPEKATAVAAFDPQQHRVALQFLQDHVA